MYVYISYPFNHILNIRLLLFTHFVVTWLNNDTVILYLKIYSYFIFNFYFLYFKFKLNYQDLVLMYVEILWI
jgi:hypothetical protein